MNTSKSIRIALINRGQTMAWLAEQIGVSRATLSNMVNGKTKFTEDRINQIAEAFELDIKEFIELSE